MGKKKERQKARQKIARKVDKWINESDLSEEELILAGLGVMARAVESGKKKLFKKALSAGRKIADLGVVSMADSPGSANGSSDSSEPVIAYGPLGGGWYSVDVDGVVVERVQGEETAAKKAAELLTAYAALDPEEQANTDTSMTHSGGGWYDLKVRGVPVARVRGKEAAEERMIEIVGAATG